MLPETERMIIRDFTINDVNDLYEILGDEETMRYSEPAYTLEQTKNFLKEFCIDRKGAAAAAIKDTGKVIGYILFAQIEDGRYFAKICKRQFGNAGGLIFLRSNGLSLRKL